MAILLDTNVVIDLLRKEPKAIRFVGSFPQAPCYCHVTVAEVFSGLRSQQEENGVERVFAKLGFASTADIAIYRSAGSLMRNFAASHGLDLADALIAATAEYHGLTLATLNVKHFPMFKRLKPAY